MLICREIWFVAIYAVWAQNQFCRNLRAFVWRKIYWEIVLLEKKGQLWGMPHPPIRDYVVYEWPLNILYIHCTKNGAVKNKIGETWGYWMSAEKGQTKEHQLLPKYLKYLLTQTQTKEHEMLLKYFKYLLLFCPNISNICFHYTDQRT